MRLFQVFSFSLAALWIGSASGQIDLPVDLDGDGVSTYGDRAVLQDWLSRGGSLKYALEHGEVSGGVIDLSGFINSPLAALDPEAAVNFLVHPKSSTAGGGSGAGAQDGGGCPQPGDSPAFTRRVPPPYNITAGIRDVRTTPDGRFMVFVTPGDVGYGSNGIHQVYLWDRGAGVNGSVIHISKDTDGNFASLPCELPSISDDGKIIAFQTLDNLDPTNDPLSIQKNDIYVRDLMSAPTTRLLSKRATDGKAGNGDSFSPSISGDSTVVVFTSAATDLVTTPTDSNGKTDVFRIGSDGLSPAMAMVSCSDVAGDPLSNADSGNNGTAILTGYLGERVGNVVGGNGNLILFHGAPTNWTFSGLDSNPAGRTQVFLRDLSGASPRTHVVSRADNITIGNGSSRRASISTNGAHISYSSLATNLTAIAPAFENVLFVAVSSVKGIGAITHSQVLDSASGIPNGRCFFPMIENRTNPAGTWIAFASEASDLATGGVADTNGHRDIYLYDAGGASLTRRFSVSSNGTQADGRSEDPDIMGNGSGVVYHSYATNLVSGDTNASFDVFETLRPGDRFIRGDANMDGTVDISDPQRIANWLWSGHPPPSNLNAADANDSNDVDNSDMIYLYNFINGLGNPPPCPFILPQPSCCGKEPTQGALTSATPPITFTCTTCN